MRNLIANLPASKETNLLDVFNHICLIVLLSCFLAGCLSTSSSRSVVRFPTDPVRDIIDPSENPPTNVGGYGLLVFTHLPGTSVEYERYMAVCNAFRSILPFRRSSSAPTGSAQLMVTYWP